MESENRKVPISSSLGVSYDIAAGSVLCFRRLRYIVRLIASRSASHAYFRKRQTGLS